MAVDFSVKGVPDSVARRLRELLCILEAAASERPIDRVAEPWPPIYAAREAGAKPGERVRRRKGRLTLEQLWDRARQMGDPIPCESSVSIIRRERDGCGLH
jgi:hypothetical protein